MYLALPHLRASQAVLVVKNLSANAGDTRDMGLIPGSGRIPWTEEPGRLQSMESQTDTTEVT